MNLIKCFQTNSTWFKGAVRNSKPVGILWHDTGAGNPSIKRYVQPHETDSNYNDMITLLGKNKYNNDWNHINHEAGVNAWIGKLADGSTATVQVGEWTMTPWGCGADSRGSLNGYIGNLDWQGVHWIQFEICDDGYGNEQYFRSVYKEACELTAFLCKEFGIDPNGTVTFNGISVPTILCHADSYDFKVGCNHIDTRTWFERYGVNMNDVRRDVTTLLGGNTLKPDSHVELHVQDTVKLKPDVTTYTNGVSLPSWLYSSTLYVRSIYNSESVVISTLREGAITGVVFNKDLILVECPHGKEEEPNYEEEKSTPDVDKIDDQPINDCVNDETTDDSSKDQVIPPIEDTEQEKIEDGKINNNEYQLTEEDKSILVSKFLDLINTIIEVFVKLFIGKK